MKSQERKKMQTKREMSRRDFVKGVGAVAAFTIVPRHVLGGPGHTPPSEKLNIAGIGVGGRWQVSTSGGSEPLWSRDGRELFYRNNGSLVAVSVETGANFSQGVPHVVLEGEFFGGEIEMILHCQTYPLILRDFDTILKNPGQGIELRLMRIITIVEA